MILVIAWRERNKYTGREELIVSHGIDLTDGDDRLVVLPQVPVEQIGAVYDPDYGEYVLVDDETKRKYYAGY